MRLDVVTIFPAYLDPLRLSLLGRAQAAGQLELVVHDLRAFAHDRHRTVDDTPAGGGPGMVMRPEPWGEAIDAVNAADPRPVTWVVPTPAGRPFRQELAEQWATRERLAFACGRYEGIDHRVVEWLADTGDVTEVSLGDYVLNGGEVAAMAIIEAVVRLRPGVLGNQDSLVEESHAAGLLEAPAYTRPAVWRERAVPAVLTAGDHAAVGRWRRQEALRRTARQRPDLLAAAAADGRLSAADREFLRRLEVEPDVGPEVQPGRRRFGAEPPPVAH